MLFVTPTFPGDFARTQLLLESIELFNGDDEHLLVVADEDLAAARRTFSASATLLSHREVLPGSSWRLHDLPRPVKQRIKLGWWLQQLAKLNIGRALGAASWVCLDSDTFLIDVLQRSDCYAEDGRPFLMELIDHPVGPHVARFNARSARLLDLPESVGSVERVYTGMCVPMSGAVADELLRWLERRHRGPWWLTMCRRKGTEYALYGQFARHHNQLRDVVVNHAYLSVDVYERRPLPDLVERIQVGRAAGRRLAMVHSHLGVSVDETRALAEAVWAR